MKSGRITLRAARFNSGMNRKEYADTIGASLYQLYNWETGRVPLPAAKLRRISEVSGVPMEELIIPEVQKRK